MREKTSAIPILCPACGYRLGSQVEDQQVLIHQGHKRALVGAVRYIKCRRSLPNGQGKETHCPGVWVPPVREVVHA